MSTDYLAQQLYNSDVLASAGLLLALAATRLLVGRALGRRETLPPQIVRRWTANLRNLLLLVGLVGLVMIWAPQLRTFALSLTAVAVALVVATKELILCLSGAALRTFTRAYAVGDYVDIGGTRGEVIDYNLLVTKLHELESRDGSFEPTGRTVILPHSLLFASPTRIEGVAGGRVRHRFELTFEPTVNLFAEGAAIENAANEAQRRCEAAVGEVSGRHQDGAAGELKTPPVRVGFVTTDIGKYRLEVTCFALPNLVAETENAIACAIGDWQHALREAQATVPGPT